jgi:DNA-binding response OmpR family regulator
MTFLKKILLVDDEPRVSAMLRDALESTGRYVIKEERDSRHAVSAARWFQPDLILFDVVTSHSSGTAAARELQTDAALRDTPLVFVSADPSGDGAVVTGGMLSGYSFLTGPVPLAQISGYVSELLDPASNAA